MKLNLFFINIFHNHVTISVKENHISWEVRKVKTHLRAYTYVLTSTVFVLSIMLNGLFGSHAQAGYLDGEIQYIGDLTKSNGLDEADGTVDDICYDNPSDLDSDVISCYMNGDDDYSDAVDIGFPFQFYGESFTQSYLNINGTLNFDCPTNEYDNETLPTTFDGDCNDGEAGAIPASILAFWDDIITSPMDLVCNDDPIPSDGSCSDWSWEGNYPTVLYKTIGTTGSRKFIAQWTNMYLYSDPNIPLGTFQIILYEADNSIQIQYRNLLGDPDRSSGSDATIGIQKNLTTYDQYSSDLTGAISEGMAIRYIPDGLGAYEPADNMATYDPIYLSLPGAPGVPLLTRPNNTAIDVARLPILEWDAATDADSYVVTLSSDGGFSSIIFQESGITGTSLTSSVQLDESTMYYWTVKAINEFGETFSTVHSFTTGSNIVDYDPDADNDGDGVPESVEQDGPNDGDANEDGIADNTQSTVTSFINPVTNTYTVVENVGCTSNGTVTAGAATTSDAGFTYPAGLTNFTLNCGNPGDSATVTLYYYGVDSTGMTLRKYNELTNEYKTVSGAVLSSVIIGGQQATKVVYDVTDGGELDQDGIANAVIVDPAGLALASAPNTGYKPQSQLVTLLLASTGISLIGLSRKFKVNEKKTV